MNLYRQHETTKPDNEVNARLRARAILELLIGYGLATGERDHEQNIQMLAQHLEEIFTVGQSAGIRWAQETVRKAR